MNKINILWVIISLTFIIIFNATFFILGGTDRSLSAWISYGFIHLAYILLVSTNLFVRSGKSAAIFGYSLFSISSTYFFLVLIAGAAFIIVSPADYKAALLVHLFITGLYIVVFISNIISNEHTAEIEEKRQCQVEYVKKATTEISSIMDGLNNLEVKKKLEKVYDAINASPVKSHPELLSMESQIIVSIANLRDAVSDDRIENVFSLSDAILSMVNERNRHLRLLH